MTMMTRGMTWSGLALGNPPGLGGESTSRSVPQYEPPPTALHEPITCGRGRIGGPRTRFPDVRTTLRQQREGSGRRRAHPAGPVQDREVPSPALRIRAAHGPLDLGLPRLG